MNWSTRTQFAAIVRIEAVKSWFGLATRLLMLHRCPVCWQASHHCWMDPSPSWIRMSSCRRQTNFSLEFAAGSTRNSHRRWSSRPTASPVPQFGCFIPDLCLLLYSSYSSFFCACRACSICIKTNSLGPYWQPGLLLVCIKSCFDRWALRARSRFALPAGSF